MKTRCVFQPQNSSTNACRGLTLLAISACGRVQKMLKRINRVRSVFNKSKWEEERVEMEKRIREMSEFDDTGNPKGFSAGVSKLKPLENTMSFRSKKHSQSAHHLGAAGDSGSWPHTTQRQATDLLCCFLRASRSRAYSNPHVPDTCFHRRASFAWQGQRRFRWSPRGKPTCRAASQPWGWPGATTGRSPKREPQQGTLGPATVAGKGEGEGKADSEARGSSRGTCY